jgi:hypothetical protein
VHLSILSKLEEGPGAIQNSKDAENITLSGAMIKHYTEYSMEAENMTMCSFHDAWEQYSVKETVAWDFFV